MKDNEIILPDGGFVTSNTCSWFEVYKIIIDEPLLEFIDEYGYARGILDIRKVEKLYIHHYEGDSYEGKKVQLLIKDGNVVL